ncbi:MAG TPA: hypothetical protein VEZ90_03255 [Blastocatellia bacterium]|nr:hypothetical protein [Blastocatellia bacterium]
MAAANLEKRIDALERELHLIKSAIAESEHEQRPWWASLAGKFKDDEVFDEIVKAGRKYRKQTRRASR